MKKIKVNKYFDIHDNLKPNEIVIFPNGNTFYKNYWGLKPECKQMPKPFSISNFIVSLYEDEFGWYNISGEIIMSID